MLAHAFLPASRSVVNLGQLKEHGQGIKDWLKEDSLSKTAAVNALALAGPKGMLVAKGIEVASTAFKMLSSDRDKATDAYSDASDKEKSTHAKIFAAADNLAIAQQQQQRRSQAEGAERMTM